MPLSLCKSCLPFSIMLELILARDEFEVLVNVCKASKLFQDAIAELEIPVG